LTARHRAAPPAPTLVVEASTYRGTVAVVDATRIIASEAVAMRGEHEERMMPALARVLDAAGLGVSEVGRIVCGAGPGSFTSLRIAAAIAKGLVTARAARRLPLGSVSSLLLIVAAAADRLDPGSYVATLDALRGERYARLITIGAGGDGSPLVAPAAGEAEHAARGDPAPSLIRAVGGWRRLSDAEVADWARDAGAILIGPGCPVEAWPEAGGVVRIWDAVMDVDPVSWAPDYGRLAEAQVRLDARASPARTGGGQRPA
jgi:tRNA threonylcarbamoyl adenosine modification protein YeaZ